MSLAPDFSNSENWRSAGSVTGIQQIEDGGKVKFIPPLTFPFVLSRPTLAIVVSALNAKDYWKYAGTAELSIRTGIVVGGNLDSSIGVRSLFLKKVNLCIFPALGTDYGLTISPPKWFQQITYNVFEYIGPGLPDVPSKLDNIHTLASQIKLRLEQ